MAKSVIFERPSFRKGSEVCFFDGCFPDMFFCYSSVIFYLLNCTFLCYNVFCKIFFCTFSFVHIFKFYIFCTFFFCAFIFCFIFFCMIVF